MVVDDVASPLSHQPEPAAPADVRRLWAERV